ncbi:hypothetical protein EIK79_10760 [Halocatena pleomorpha]|uniref:MarR family transcriptional regulator n=1 Tax=Halocatena pleomorpha TaxID=1785090 RepID=A0A3P3RAR7_9EURY|nr:hypothetical protein [Halocatena pleomorpha]RRJ30059.1 hypothetical protein EIK79_10760 [Halocatena pleomorpha]
MIEGPTDASTLTQTVSVSRSTIDRALSAFKEWGLIVSDSDRIEPTLFARLVGKVYTDFETEVGAVGRNLPPDSPSWSAVGTGADAVKLVTTRIDLLEYAETARTKRTLVTELPYARSTVDRAVRELEQAGLIQRTAAGYATTDVGQWITARYHVAHEAIADVLAVRDLLRYLPTDEMFPPALFGGIDIERAERTVPYHLLKGLREHLVAAERIRAVLPTLPTPQFLSVCHRQVIQRGTTFELITTPALADTLTDEFPRLLAEMTDATTGSITTSTGTTPPFGLILSTTDAGLGGSVLVYDDHQSVIGAFHADSDAALTWIKDYYEHLHEQATKITPEWLDAITTEASNRPPLSTTLDHARREDESSDRCSYDFIYRN